MQNTATRINEGRPGLGSQSPMGFEGEIADVANTFLAKLKSYSNDYAKESVEFVKKYPLHTAVGALAIGYVAGMLLSRSSK